MRRARRTPLGGRWAGLALLLAATGACAQEPMSWSRMQEAIRAQDVPVAERLPYGPGPHRYGELTLPQGDGPHPVAVVVHGGCWLSIADLSYMRPLARELNRAGWATWTLEFTRIDQEGGGWPGILSDVARGADHLAELARSRPLDLERVVAVGHSSGGHLALWLAGRGSLPAGTETPRLSDPALAIRGVVGLAPITDLEDYQARSDRCGPTVVADLLDAPVGTSTDGPASGAESRETRLALTDPARLLPLGVPQLIVMGELDAIVPPEHGMWWRRRAEARGDVVELAVIPGAGHFELVAPWSPPWDSVESRVRSFLSRFVEGG